ncbi:uncharacterized protein [Equus caballus]|uniref:uncharacterized protein isoform X2 n=1 Tax=Equus caballus TaxID=9796 RepID=UPI0038B2F73F
MAPKSRSRGSWPAICSVAGSGGACGEVLGPGGPGCGRGGGSREREPVPPEPSAPRPGPAGAQRPAEEAPGPQRWPLSPETRLWFALWAGRRGRGPFAPCPGPLSPRAVRRRLQGQQETSVTSVKDTALAWSACRSLGADMLSAGPQEGELSVPRFGLLQIRKRTE